VLDSTVVPPTRRHFLRTLAAGASLAGIPRFAFAQGKPITVAHSVSTFVYGRHLVAREENFFEEEGVIAVSACYRAQ